MSSPQNPGRNSVASAAPRNMPFSLEPILRRLLAPPQRELAYEIFNEFSAAEEELSPERLAAAVQANRRLARQLGWGCVVGGVLQLTNPDSLIQNLLTTLGLGANPS